MFFPLAIVEAGKRTGKKDDWTYTRFGLALVHAAGPARGAPLRRYRNGDPVTVITTLASAARGAPQWMHRAVSDCRSRGGVTLDEAAPFAEWHRLNARKRAAVYDCRPEGLAAAAVETYTGALELVDDGPPDWPELPADAVTGCEW